MIERNEIKRIINRTQKSFCAFLVWAVIFNLPLNRASLIENKFNDNIVDGDVCVSFNGETDIDEMIIAEIQKLRLPDEYSMSDLLGLSYELDLCEKILLEYLSEKSKISSEVDFKLFFQEVGPFLLEIMTEEKLSYGIWQDRHFVENKINVNELPKLIIEKNEMMGAVAQTNYRKKTIRFNKNVISNSIDTSLAVFLIAHELAHYTGTNDELFHEDDLTHETAAQLVALETLARGYFKYKDEDPELAIFMLSGFIRGFRLIIDNSVLYIIEQEKDEKEKEQMLRLYNSFLTLIHDNPSAIPVERINPKIAELYGYLPLLYFLNQYSKPLLVGNSTKRVNLESSHFLMCGLVGKSSK